MGKLIKWLKAASTRIFDPYQEQRVMTAAGAVWKALSEHRSRFDFDQMMPRLCAEPQDIPLVAERVYEMALIRAWEDQQITDKERASLRAIASWLRLDAQRVAKAQWAVGVGVFENLLGKVISDGHISSAESEALQRVAAGLGVSLQRLMTQTFSEKGEAILRSLFSKAISQGQFNTDHWDRLVKYAKRIGLSDEALRGAVRPLARRYIENVLVDAKADGRISDAERETITWLLETLDPGAEVVAYVNGEIATVDLFENISLGRLPSLEISNVALKGGELVHFQGWSTYTQVRQRQGGQDAQRFDGVVTITDLRSIFTAQTKSFEVTHRRVISLLPFARGVEVRCRGIGAGFYDFGTESRLAGAILRVAVGKANQTIVESVDGLPSRHIRRDVRQRIWQRYGGRCAECGSEHSLEFDHIVPVAKGGNNSENNVQLLCRQCNQKKSDAI